METNLINLNTEEDSGDELQLPADTLAILQEFLKEKEENTDEIEEDWQLSQFWYNDSTKVTLASACQQVLKTFYKETIDECHVALMSCPSLYEEFKKRIDKTTIFEYDNRFSKYGSDFVKYDYNRALEDKYLEDQVDKYQLVVLDPPFLSEECLEKSSAICKKIAKKDARIILCTGKVMEQPAEKYLNLKRCKYMPEHERNLGNDFATYANFDLDEFIKEEG